MVDPAERTPYRDGPRPPHYKVIFDDSRTFEEAVNKAAAEGYEPLMVMPRGAGYCPHLLMVRK